MTKFSKYIYKAYNHIISATNIMKLKEDSKALNELVKNDDDRNQPFGSFSALGAIIRLDFELMCLSEYKPLNLS